MFSVVSIEAVVGNQRFGSHGHISVEDSTGIRVGIHEFRRVGRMNMAVAVVCGRFEAVEKLASVLSAIAMYLDIVLVSNCLGSQETMTLTSINPTIPKQQRPRCEVSSTRPRVVVDSTCPRTCPSERHHAFDGEQRSARISTGGRNMEHEGRREQRVTPWLHSKIHSSFGLVPLFSASVWVSDMEAWRFSCFVDFVLCAQVVVGLCG